MTRNTGGPAFPTENERQTGANSFHYEGMTLRDYFAAKAMAAIVSQAKINPCGDFVADDCLLQDYRAPKYAARTAYQFADAMLAERAKQ